MFKMFDKLNYSFIFWFYFAFVTVFIREYYLEEKLFVFNIFPDKINISFIITFIAFIVYTLFIFIMILRKSKTNSTTNKFLIFLGNLIVTVHLIYSSVQTYNLVNLTILKDYHITSQIEELKKSLPISVNSFTQLIDINAKNNQISYVYKLNQSKSDIEMFDLKSFKNGVQESLCNEDYSLNVLKKDYTLNYNYLDKNKEVIANIKTTKENCGKSIYDLDYLKVILMDKKI